MGLDTARHHEEEREWDQPSASHDAHRSRPPGRRDGGNDTVRRFRGSGWAALLGRMALRPLKNPKAGIPDTENSESGWKYEPGCTQQQRWISYDKERIKYGGIHCHRPKDPQS